MEPGELDRLLREGITAARAGSKDRARDLLLQVIAQDQEVEMAWLWLSSVVDNPGELQICLENVLALNPANEAARRGLDWLAEQTRDHAPQVTDSVERVVAVPTQAPLAAQPRDRIVLQSKGEPSPPTREHLVKVEIDPYGCPYCGGSVSDEQPRCDHCSRMVTVRRRKRMGQKGVGMLAIFYLLLGIAAWLEGTLVSQSVAGEILPVWLNQTFVSMMVSPSLFSVDRVGALVQFASVVTLSNYVLAGACVAAAVGLALQGRIAYFGSFLLAGLMVVLTLAGLLVQVLGVLPALFRLTLVAICVKVLADSSIAFEWNTVQYDADLDSDLKTDRDYHNRAQIYYDQGMWAKAAAHWQVARRLAPTEVQYRAELANAYVRMGYPAAAQSEAEEALSLAPEDRELRAFRDSLASQGGMN